jgi:hypothetical protein
MSAVLDAPCIAAPKVSVAARHDSSQTVTTLFDLLASFQEAIPAQDDALIVATVADLLQAGHIRFLPQLPGNPDRVPHDSQPN